MGSSKLVFFLFLLHVEVCSLHVRCILFFYFFTLSNEIRRNYCWFVEKCRCILVAVPYNNCISFDAYANWNVDFQISILLFRLSSFVFLPTTSFIGMRRSWTYSFSFRVIALFLYFYLISLLFCHLMQTCKSLRVCFMCTIRGTVGFWISRKCLKPCLYALMSVQIASTDARINTPSYFIWRKISSFSGFQQNTTRRYGLVLGATPKK